MLSHQMEWHVLDLWLVRYLTIFVFDREKGYWEQLVQRILQQNIIFCHSNRPTAGGDTHAAVEERPLCLLQEEIRIATCITGSAL